MKAIIARWIQRLRDYNAAIAAFNKCGTFPRHAWGEKVLMPEWCVPYQPAYKVTCARCGAEYRYEPPNR